jgi:AcrR family transcriptional regulator
MTTTTTTTTANGAVTTNGATAGSTLELVERARASLLEACLSRAVTDRYLQSRLAALRAAAALVSARAAAPVDPGPRNLWDLLPAVAPELTEWAAFFDAAGRRLDAGPTAREADDLLRQAETFVDLVCRALGLPIAPPHDAVLVPTAWA